jgi:hypothetical protein
MLTYRPGTVYGSSKPQFNAYVGQTPRVPVNQQPNQNITRAPQLPRALNYLADYSGCGYWRMGWPEQGLTAYQKMIIHGSTCMIKDKDYYGGVKSIRVQRQASPHQKMFFNFLRNVSEEIGFRLIYEIDDIVFHEDIPDYNKYKPAFADPQTRDNIISMMCASDEITCTCDFMKDYYQSKTGNPNITVVPNYPPRWWLDGFYDEERLQINYDRHVKKRKQPRVLWAGSGAHFDTDNRANQQDDFSMITDVVIKTRNKFKWVFVGGYPRVLHDLVKSGHVEYHEWQPLYDIPRFIHSLKVNAMIAPLIDNTFNRAKSSIKYTEACAYGLPISCQDMVTYNDAQFKFNTPQEMVDQLDYFFKDKQHYMKLCRKARLAIEDQWLEDHLDEYVELYTLPYAHPDRKNLNKINHIK